MDTQDTLLTGNKAIMRRFMEKVDNKHLHRIYSLLIMMILFSMLLVSADCTTQKRDERKEAVSVRFLANTEDVVCAIRSGLKNHSRTITITFKTPEDIRKQLGNVVEQWMEAALQETDAPDEGDYIRYQYGGYTSKTTCTETESSFHYTVEIEPEYYTYLYQEELVTEKVAQLQDYFTRYRSNVFLPDIYQPEIYQLELFMPEIYRSKICLSEVFLPEMYRPEIYRPEVYRTKIYQPHEQIWMIYNIYDYICENVQYDRVHQKNPYSHLKSTAYAALIQKTATCQGYCTALYRLLREVGVDCRIVTGTVEGELHAWVIAEIDGLYYNLDPTWDAGQDIYRYFLSGSDNFQERTLSDAFLSPEFNRRYPMSPESYLNVYADVHNLPVAMPEMCTERGLYK